MSSRNAIHKQNASPNVAILKTSLGIFLYAAKIITTYPINPYNGVGIPSVLDTSPDITALQLIELFT
jgi:hypothetical protein